MGPENHVLDENTDFPCEWAFLTGKRGGPLQSIGTLCCAKTVKPIETVWEVDSGGHKEACVR